MNDQLAGKRCVVTGGGRGIGKAISLEIARRGAAAVAILGTNEEIGRQTASEVAVEGAMGVFVPATSPTRPGSRRRSTNPPRRWAGSTSWSTTQP
jgi:NAD(P)-dependent dehydrogenase (short-subunit alcohol dehydrogenase family)